MQVTKLNDVVMMSDKIIAEKPLTRSELKRLSILDSAKSAFLEKGYDSVSMDFIAEKASVSKRTVYSHFGSKDVLFGDIMLVTCSIKQQEMQSGIDIEKPIEDVLTEIGRTFLTFMFDFETIALLRILIGNTDQLPGLGEMFFDGGPEEIIKALAHYLVEVEKTGLIKVDKPELAAASFMSSLLGHDQMRALATNLPLPDEQLIEDKVQGAVDRFLHGVLVK